MNASIRWASPQEGSIIETILHDQHVSLAVQVDWSLPLGPYWLLYCDPIPLGCINVNPGTPVGRLEWLTVHSAATHRQRALATKFLCYAGMAALRDGGSQLVAGYVNDTDTGWKKIIEKRKLYPQEHGTLYLGGV